MTADEKVLALEKLADNDTFMDSYYKVESKQQLKELFAQYDVEMDHDEIDAFVSVITANDDELDENALEDVSGGVASVTILKWSYTILKKTGKWAWKKGKQLADWEEKLLKKLS